MTDKIIKHNVSNKSSQKDSELITRRSLLKNTFLASVGLAGFSLVSPTSILGNSSKNNSAKKNIKWFKSEFQTTVQNKVKNTPFSIEMITAVAVQETGYLWTGYRRKGLSTADILKLCVGDTLDAPKRGAFPKNKKRLLKHKKGKEMFDIARQALLDIGKYNSTYRRVARKYPNKFCRGFGIFQYDLQFFKENDPDFFLNKDWYDFEKCLETFIDKELNPTFKRVYPTKTKLTDKEMVYVAIAYNKGSVNLSKDFKQGYKDSNGIYYGEHIYKYLKLSRTIKV